MKIQPYDDSKLDAIVRLSLRAWEPVFDSIRKAMDPDVYSEQHPDWRVTQKDAVESVCADVETRVWTASEGSQTIGFVAVKLHSDERLGEIYMIEVDPKSQRRGVATALTKHALAWWICTGMH